MYRAILLVLAVLVCAAHPRTAMGEQPHALASAGGTREPHSSTSARGRTLRPPTRRELDALHRLRSDSIQGTICPVRNSSRAHCRDPRSYVHTNEARSFLFAPYIRDLGGGYVGVGADGNYTLIAHARSEWVWLLDHDPVIVRLHFLLRAFVLASPTPREFIARFQKRSRAGSVRTLRQFYHEGPALDEIIYIYRKYRVELLEHYRTTARSGPPFGDFGWLRNSSAYAHIRLLYGQDRIALVYGDLLQTNTVLSIGRSARTLGATVRIYYPSNAEEYWAFTRNYRNNVRSLPFDARSVVIRSLSPHRVRLHRDNRWHAKRHGRYWHYIVHAGLPFQEQLADPRFGAIDAFKPLRSRTRFADLSLIGLKEL